MIDAQETALSLDRDEVDANWGDLLDRHDGRLRPWRGADQIDAKRACVKLGGFTRALGADD